jgi:uncharacterized protein YlzI (FlbEa/FlbD family)
MRTMIHFISGETMTVNENPEEVHRRLRTSDGPYVELTNRKANPVLVNKDHVDGIEGYGN